MSEPFYSRLVATKLPAHHELVPALGFFTGHKQARVSVLRLYGMGPDNDMPEGVSARSALDIGLEYHYGGDGRPHTVSDKFTRGRWIVIETKIRKEFYERIGYPPPPKG